MRGLLLLLLAVVAAKDETWCRNKMDRCRGGSCTRCCRMLMNPKYGCEIYGPARAPVPTTASTTTTTTTTPTTTTPTTTTTRRPIPGPPGTAPVEPCVFDLNNRIRGEEAIKAMTEEVELADRVEGEPVLKLSLHSDSDLRTTMAVKNQIAEIIAQQQNISADAVMDDDSVYFAGDMLVTPKQASHWLDNLLWFEGGDGQSLSTQLTFSTHSDGRRKRSVVATELWDRDIFYTFDRFAATDAKVVDEVGRAADFWSSHTCLNLKRGVPPSWDEQRKGYLVIIKEGVGCASYKGRLGGPQAIHVGSLACAQFGVLSHEFGHALGLWHEHQRTDRRDYIDIISRNVDPRKHENFLRCDVDGSCFANTPYDYGSVMHYDTYAFSMSLDNPTIVTRDRNAQNTIGARRPGPSFYDVLAVNRAYNCDWDCPGNETVCENGGYPHPRDCGSCLCPTGFDGRLCQYIPAGAPAPCGGTVSVGWEWDGIQNPDYPLPMPFQQNCTWRLRAPRGWKLELAFEGFFAFETSDSCEQNYVEVKRRRDLAMTGVRFCGVVRPNETLESEGNEALILLRLSSPQYWHEGFRLRFRAKAPPTTTTSTTTTTTTTTMPSTTTLPPPTTRDDCPFVARIRCTEWQSKARTCKTYLPLKWREWCPIHCLACEGRVRETTSTTPTTTTAPTTTTTRPPPTTNNECRYRLIRHCVSGDGVCLAVPGSQFFRICQRCGRCRDFSQNCPLGWDRWSTGVSSIDFKEASSQESDRLCYHQLNQEAQTWAGARNDCAYAMENATLPTFENTAQLEHFIAHLSRGQRKLPDTRVWVGLVDLNGDGRPEGEHWEDGRPYSAALVSTAVPLDGVSRRSKRQVKIVRPGRVTIIRPPDSDSREEFRWSLKLSNEREPRCAVANLRRRSLEFQDCADRLPAFCQFRRP